jgi:hypothetical protein
MVTVIVDGYNAIHAIPSLARHLDRSLEAARTALVALCGEYKTARGDVGELYVVFDGKDRDVDAWGSQQQRQGVTVLFTRQHEEADERILRLIRGASGRGRFVVVSNDTVVSNNVRALGAQAVSVNQFHGGKPSSPRAARGRRPSSDAKPPLPTRDLERITEEYRRHLEQGRDA